MQEIREIRRDNLIRLLSNHKSQRQFAESVGLVPSLVSQLVNGTRSMGEDVARRIEQALGLSAGFMSVAPVAPVARPTIDEALQNLPSDELKLLTNYRRISSRRKEMLRETAEGYVMLEKRSDGPSHAG